MSETVTASDGDDDKLEPIRESVRDMIEKKKTQISEIREHVAKAASVQARGLQAEQEALSELLGLELALRRLGGE